MEVCPEAELIAFEDPATVCDRAFQIGQGREAQMIGHMRHGSPPRLMVLQSILSPNRGESLSTPSAGVRMTGSGKLSKALRRSDPIDRSHEQSMAELGVLGNTAKMP